MSDVWNRVYGEDSSFFGDEPSHFALLCYERSKKYNVKGLLELGCGQGRDTLFFASKGIAVKTLDYSKIAVDAVVERAKVRSLPITATVHDGRKGLPYKDQEFDAVYSHMFFTMHFTNAELKFLFSEVRRILKPNGFHFFSVRSDKDQFYGKGKQVADGIYDVNGFQIRFLGRKEILDLTKGFNIDEIIEDTEEPASLYLAFCRKTRLVLYARDVPKTHQNL